MWKFIKEASKDLDKTHKREMNINEEEPSR